MKCFIYTNMFGTGDNPVKWNRATEKKKVKYCIFSPIWELEMKTQGHKSKKVITRKLDGKA